MADGPAPTSPTESFFGKYKYWIVGGAIAVAALIILQQLSKRKAPPSRPALDQPLNQAMQYAQLPPPGYGPPPGYPGPPGMPIGVPPGPPPGYPGYPAYPGPPPPPPGGYPPAPGQAGRQVPSYPTQMPGTMMPPPQSTLQPPAMPGMPPPGGPGGFTPMSAQGPPMAMQGAPMGAQAQPQAAAAAQPSAANLGGVPMMGSAGSGPVQFVGDLPTGAGGGPGPGAGAAAPPTPAGYSLS